MIDFELSEEQQMTRDSVGAFAREEIRPAARPADETGSIPAALVAKAWQLGLVGGRIPEKFGGGGDARSAVTGAIVAEELGFGDISIGLHVLAPRLFAFPIVEMGTDDQRAKYLKRFAGADFAAATAAVMEPRFDYDLSALQVSAKRDGAGYVLNGGKCDVARDYAKERKAFGVPIATKQAIAFILADMAIEIDAARLLVWEAAYELDKGRDALKQSYQAKNYVANRALKVTDNGVQVLGGHGYIREHPVEMWLRNARGFSAIEGIATV